MCGEPLIARVPGEIVERTARLDFGRPEFERIGAISG